MSAAFRKAAKSRQRQHRERAQVGERHRGFPDGSRDLGAISVLPSSSSLPVPAARLQEEAGAAGEEAGLPAAGTVSRGAGDAG